MKQTDSPHRLLSILAADAAGYSRLMADDDRATVATLDDARAVFDGHIGSFGGRVIDMTGDSVLAVFETAAGAVLAAIAAQEQLEATARSLPEARRMRFRIGVHLGDVIQKADGSVYGDGVNIAARLQALAEPGGVNVSQAVHGIVLSRVPAGFDDLGEQQVKNIAQPVRAFRVRMNGVAAAADGLRFGRFELQPRARRVLVDGAPASLGARAFDLLLALAERPGRLVSKNELLDLVWPDVAVEKNNLQQHMSTLHKLLGPEVIATMPGRGYRFVAQLDRSADAAQPAAPHEALAAPLAEPPPASPALRTNLPATLAPLIGRNDDLAAVGALIDEHRLVTLVGAGGMGKTLLAQHLLASRERRYAHGVCWVELAPVSDPAAIAGAVTAALGVQRADGEPLAALAKALAPLDLLLALDNAEHLLAEVAAVAEALHRAAPKLRLLVTSQAPLKLAAERVVRIGSLSVPQGPLPAADALAFGAVALFTERAQSADARFALNDANAPAVIELCRALDGMALAIELAAARAPALGVQRLAASMHERLRLLTTSRNRAAPARQQTLRAALEWSHALLDEREQALFRRLAVVAGSASLELIQQIASCERWSEWDVLDALDVLVERSLVQVVSFDDASAPRYRLLDSPRAFAGERLQAAGEADALRRRHALAVQVLLEAIERERYDGRIGVAAGRALAWLDVDNAREAFAWARGGGETELAVALATQLLPLLRDQVEAEALALCDACEPLLAAPLPHALLAAAWYAVGHALGNVRTRRSFGAAQRAVEAARLLPQTLPAARPLLFRALSRLTWAANSIGEPATAAAALAEAAALDQPDWPAALRVPFADARSSTAVDPAERARLAQAAMLTSHEAGHPAYAALVNLVDAQLTAGDTDAAVKSGSELIALLEGSRDENPLAYARLNLAAARLAQGDAEHARELLQAGWSQALGFDYMTPYFADYLALLAALDGRPRAAARLAGYADARYAAFDDRRQVNEAAAVNRARAAARAALGEVEFERLVGEGAALRDADIAALAFGNEDRP